MRIGIGSDESGYQLKQVVARHLRDHGDDLVDYGPLEGEQPEYSASYARRVAHAIRDGEVERGVLICGTGVGISIAANKIDGIRAALCTDVFSAIQSRKHNDANVLALGGRVTGVGPAGEIVRAWMRTTFEGGRHARRVEKIMALQDKKTN